jgi:hypothetical protein
MRPCQRRDQILALHNDSAGEVVRFCLGMRSVLSDQTSITPISPSDLRVPGRFKTVIDRCIRWMLESILNLESQN